MITSQRSTCNKTTKVKEAKVLCVCVFFEVLFCVVSFLIHFCQD
jgi:hypothetical protein